LNRKIFMKKKDILWSIEKETQLFRRVIKKESFLFWDCSRTLYFVTESPYNEHCATLVSFSLRLFFLVKIICFCFVFCYFFTMAQWTAQQKHYRCITQFYIFYFSEHKCRIIRSFLVCVPPSLAIFCFYRNGKRLNSGLFFYVISGFYSVSCVVQFWSIPGSIWVWKT